MRRFPAVLCLTALVASAPCAPGWAAEDGDARETFGDWAVEQGRAEDGSPVCHLEADVEGMAGEVGLVAAADGARYLAFRDDRVLMPGEWVGRTIGVAFPGGARYALQIARLLRSDGAARPANTALARLGPADMALVQRFYAESSVTVLLPDGGVHGGLLSGAGEAAEAMAACERRIRGARE